MFTLNLRVGWKSVCDPRKCIVGNDHTLFEHSQAGKIALPALFLRTMATADVAQIDGGLLFSLIGAKLGDFCLPVTRSWSCCCARTGTTPSQDGSRNIWTRFPQTPLG